jgi:hypothetical protein
MRRSGELLQETDNAGATRTITRHRIGRGHARSIPIIETLYSGTSFRHIDVVSSAILRLVKHVRRQAPWIAAALICLFAILTRQFLIQPPEIAHQCETTTLTLFAAGPWWCSVRAAAIMTYAWNWLLYGALLLSLATLVWRRLWLAVLTLAVGLLAIVWYTYEPGAVAITIGALVLARRQHDRSSRALR